MPDYTVIDDKVPFATVASKKSALQTALEIPTTAADLPFVPPVSLSATDTQAALEEVAAKQLVRTVDTFIQFPSFDGCENNIHVDVIRNDSLIFGYRYWAAYTGMGSNREHPQVAASNDGINWEIPFGAKNPLVTRYSDITLTPYPPSVIGDCDIVWDGTKLRVFFLATWTPGGGGNMILVTESLDGKTWSTPAECFSSTDGGGASLASPAVVYESGTTFTMFYMQSVTGQYRVHKRTSTDSCATWGSATQCTFPLGAANNPRLWHLDMAKRGTEYHALVMYVWATAQEPQGYFGFPTHIVSADGTDFGNGAVPAPCLPWLDREIMQTCYRGCLVQSLSDATAWDVWMPSLTNYSEPSGVSSWTRILIHRFHNMQLTGTEPVAPSVVASASNIRNITPRRSVVLDQDVEFSAVSTEFASLNSRSANPWGLYYFAVPIRDGETVHVRAVLHVKCLIGGVPSGDNYAVVMRPLAAASTAGFWTLRVIKLNGTSAATEYIYAQESPAEGMGLRTAVGGGGNHIIEIEGTFTYSPGNDSTTIVGPRVTPQSTPATYGNVKILKGSMLMVNRIGHYEVNPLEIIG